MMRTLVVIGLIASGPSVALSQEKAGTIAGFGWVSCAQFAQYYQQDPRGTESYMFAWAQGYMAGLNEVWPIKKNVVGWENDKQKDRIRAYCNQHPLANVVDAVRDVFMQLPDR
jgi:hypothetical protein